MERSDVDEMLAGTVPNDPYDPYPECAACKAPLQACSQSHTSC